MTRAERLVTVFVAEIPEILEDGILYVCRECCVALHNCACGCGEEVSTPLVPTEYRLTMHGDDASVWPSIGNHDFACGSHYVIEHGRIVWAGRMTRSAIELGRKKDRLLKRPPPRILIPQASQPNPRHGTKRPFFRRSFDWLQALYRSIF